MTSEKAGDVELRAKIDNAAPVEILGRVNPLAADLFLDIKASAKDIELPPMSPYSIKYAATDRARQAQPKYHTRTASSQRRTTST
jgi:hypothetical protein